MLDRSDLLSERRLPESMRLDQMSIPEAVALMHQQDLAAVAAVGKVQDAIGRAVELVEEALRGGGRLVYVGAGTSGRLGVLDAAECPPTFRTDPQMVQGLIAGGEAAMFRAQEGAEDSRDKGSVAMAEKNIGSGDVVMGIAAGGTTPFVWGALDEARRRGARTIFLSCVQAVVGEPEVDLVIRPLVGPEVVTGSTRLKAGTATKLVLNAITTVAMVRLGKVYENLMVDLKASNAKLRDRAVRIVCTVTQTTKDHAAALLDQCGGHVKLAIIMQQRGVDAEEAQRLIEAAGGKLREVISPSGRPS